MVIATVGKREFPTVLQHHLPCRGAADPDLWFAEDPSALEYAKQQCADCPIKAMCLAEALRRAEPWGVWGGEIVREGEVVSFKRGRGRPRSVIVGAGVVQ